MKSKRSHPPKPEPTSFIGQLAAEAAMEEELQHAALVKKMRRLFGQIRKGRPSGKRWELLDSIKLAEYTLGHGAVRLEHLSVRQAIDDAIQENDWHFLYLLSRWHEKERKPTEPDALASFMQRNWKQLRQFSDATIAQKAKAAKIVATPLSVRGRRLKMRLKRPAQ